MSWKTVLLTANGKPPTIRVSLKDSVLRVTLSPEIAKAVGLTPQTKFSALVGIADDHGQIKITRKEDGDGLIKGSVTSPMFSIPAESTWQDINETVKCDYEIEDDTLIVNLPWFTPVSNDMRLHAAQKINSVDAANMIRQFGDGVSRRRLSEVYEISEATVTYYTRDPVIIRQHNEAVRRIRAERENAALNGSDGTRAPQQTPVREPPITVVPPRTAKGAGGPVLRKAAR